jgi:hypothetical protein
MMKLEENCSNFGTAVHSLNLGIIRANNQAMQSTS